MLPIGVVRGETLATQHGGQACDCRNVLYPLCVVGQRLDVGERHGRSEGSREEADVLDESDTCVLGQGSARRCASIAIMWPRGQSRGKVLTPPLPREAGSEQRSA